METDRAEHAREELLAKLNDEIEAESQPIMGFAGAVDNHPSEKKEAYRDALAVLDKWFPVVTNDDGE